MGSSAIADSAEYGDVCPALISLRGSSCSADSPAWRSQSANAGRSAISPIPQLREEGIENSGMSAPARLPAMLPLGIDALKDPAYALVELRRRRQQAQDEERLVRKIEEVARVHEHPVVFEKLQHQLFFTDRGRDAQDGRPPAVRVQNLHRRPAHSQLAQQSVIA